MVTLFMLEPPKMEIVKVKSYFNDREPGFERFFQRINQIHAADHFVNVTKNLQKTYLN